MRLLIVIILAFTSLNSFAQNLNVQFKMNKIHSLVVFSYSLIDIRGYSPAIKEGFEHSPFYTETVKSIINDQKKLIEDLAVYAEYRNAGTYYGDEFSVKSLIEVQASMSRDLDDLSGRIRGLLPVGVHQTFINNLKKLEPSFESFLWKPSEGELQKMVNFYSQKSTEWKLDQMFQKAKIFYGSRWDDNVPFDIVLYPIPSGSKHSNAKSFGSFESVGIVINEKDVEGRVGVIFHEICHSLYSAQSPELKETLTSSLKIRSENAFESGTATYLNEILATVLGNGIVYEKVRGEVDKMDWYNVSYINWGARDILALTKKYLDEGKQIDKEYLKALQGSFEKRFPAFDKEFSWLFSKVEIHYFKESLNTADVRTNFKKAFRYESLSIYGVEKYLDKLVWKETDIKSKILLITKKDLVQLKRNISISQKVLTKLGKSKGINGAYYFSDKEKVVYLLVNDPEHLITAFDNLSKMGTLKGSAVTEIN
ncbi:MAG: hypothetical protein Q7U04_01900 [Bacteriovorax sp.]|nr:hypothetical protein [Bacteriovorax sp.]